MDKKFQVIGMGMSLLDILVNVNKLPTSNKGSQILAFSWQYGGKVASAMAALGRLGIKCSYTGVIGDDPDGKAQMRDFIKNGVDLSSMVIDKDYDTCACMVMSDRETQGRSVFGIDRNVRALTIDDMDKDFIQSANYLHIEGNSEAVRQSIKWMHEAGGEVTCDADRYSDTLHELIGEIDIFIPSEFYYKTKYPDLTPIQACRELKKLGPHTVIITLGEKGCVGISKEGEFDVPAYKIDVVDTTGAGDVFHGAYFHGLVNGYSAKECAKFASAVSAIKCTAMGGRAGLPTLKMVNEFIETGYIDSEIFKERERYYSIPPYLAE